MHSDSGSESRHSPSSSVSSTQYGVVRTPPTYYFTAGSHMNSMEMIQQRQPVPSTEPRRVSVPLSQPQYALPTSYAMAPTTHNMNSYYPKLDGNSQVPNGIYYQRPLPNVRDPHLQIAFKISANISRLTVPSNFYKPLATPPLHSAVIIFLFPTSPGPLHLPNLQQDVLPPLELENTQPQPYGREAVPLPGQRMRKEV